MAEQSSPGPRVLDQAFEVLRRHGLATVFSNPGSTELPLLASLPPDFNFILGLHEASVVGMATGWAIGRRHPALVVLHTAAGLGNAVGALATARVNRAPLVVIIGEQDRRHSVLEPFLAGNRLDMLAGSYPVWVAQPVRAQDVPGALARARHEADANRGPALVIVPMDDWEAPAETSSPPAAAGRVYRSVQAPTAAVRELAALLDAAQSPAIVVGAGADDPVAWRALVRLAELLQAPVWQEAFGARAGFPQDHLRFAGHLPANRSSLRAVLSDYDLILSVGAPVFRQYAYEPGPLFGDRTQVAVVTGVPEEAHMSPAALAVVGSPAEVCKALVRRVEPRHEASPAPIPRPAPPAPPPTGAPLRAGHVLAALAERLPRNAILLEECPSNRSELHARIPAREPLGFVSAAMGGLGFAMPAAIGIRMALESRPTLAVVGDGSSLYAIQCLWSAVHYRVGVLFLVLDNGGYAIMDQLASRYGGRGPWPGFAEADLSTIARGFGCEALDIEGHDDLVAALDTVLPKLAARESPFLLVIRVARDRGQKSLAAGSPA